MPIDPIRLYEVHGQVSTVAPAVVQLDPGANQTVVSAVSGKRIRVMGFWGQSNTTTVPQVGFHDGSGGAYLMPDIYLPINTSPMLVIPITDSGYFETSTGVGLFITVQTAAVKMQVYYITYTPA